MPELVLKKRGPKGATVKAKNNPATQPGQPAQIPQVPQTPQTPYGYQNQHVAQASGAGATNAGPVPSTVTSASMGAPCQDLASMVPAPVFYSPILTL